jgi:hypothetical protein
MQVRKIQNSAAREDALKMTRESFTDVLVSGACPSSAVGALEYAASDPSTEIDSESACECSDDSCDDDFCPVRPDDTILIFDWDDTVLPSTWIHLQGLTLDEDSRPTVEQRAQLDQLAERAAHTLRVARRYGKVVFVTNAEAGWLVLSCQKFMPSLWPELEGVRLVSARSTYEHQGVASPFEWKYLAFESEIGAFYGACDADRQKSVISIGDSTQEREALIRVTQRISDCRTKSLKLVERPGVDQLLKEHQILADCMHSIVGHDGNLDLCIGRPGEGALTDYHQCVKVGSNLAFTVKGAGVRALNGLYAQAGEHSGRPRYLKVHSRRTVVEWSESRKAWRFFIDRTWLGVGRVTLYTSAEDTATFPRSGWVGREGEQPAPKLLPFAPVEPASPVQVNRSVRRALSIPHGAQPAACDPSSTQPRATRGGDFPSEGMGVRRASQGEPLSATTEMVSTLAGCTVESSCS